jgi:hypothetical protein
MAVLETKQVFSSLVKSTTQNIKPKITTIAQSQKITTKQDNTKKLVNDCLVNKGRFKL